MTWVLTCVQRPHLTNVSYQNHTYTLGLAIQKVFRQSDGSLKPRTYCFRAQWIVA